MRVATAALEKLADQYVISIHATHAGGDLYRVAKRRPKHYFNPRHPCGWRRLTWSFPFGLGTISIHATHAGGDGSYVTDVLIL